MASAVVRIKRRTCDEPLDKFVLNCKRARRSEPINDDKQKSDENPTEDTTQTIVKLATTVSAEDDLATHLRKLRKPEAEQLARKVQNPIGSIQRRRQRLQNEMKEQRYQIINMFRSEQNAIDSAVPDGADITVVDVIKEEDTENIKPIESIDISDSKNNINNSQFVYDLYLLENVDPTEMDLNDINIRPFDDLVYRAGENMSDTDTNDSDDSNNEENYRNDYPDTDDGFSIDEDDIRRAVEDINIDSDPENLSTDDDDNNLIYGEDPIVHFANADSDDEYAHLKKHGRIKSHAPYYRTANRNRRIAQQEEDDFDDESDDEENDTDSSRSSESNVSPLISCDEDDQN